jgi:hypothetical protein
VRLRSPLLPPSYSKAQGDVATEANGRRAALASEGRVDSLWTGDDYEVAIISKETGRSAIDVRRAIMKVCANRARIIAELKQPPAVILWREASAPRR